MLSQAWSAVTNMLVNVSGPTNPPIVSPPAIADRHITTRTDCAGSKFPDDEGGDGPRNVDLPLSNLTRLLPGEHFILKMRV
jgi:hypothetical protein